MILEARIASLFPENAAELIQNSVPISIPPVEPQWQLDDLPA